MSKYKYIVSIICFLTSIAMMVYPLIKPVKSHINVYPNLPAPIGEEEILFTSAGQASEGSIVYEIASDLHLKGDYRPRALASDLYDYKTLVVSVGYSANGLLDKRRTFAEEKQRTLALLKEARMQKIPILILYVSGQRREDPRTWELLQASVPFADYFIGLKSMKQREQVIAVLNNYHVPVTLVNHLHDIKKPFNSAFR